MEGTIKDISLDFKSPTPRRKLTEVSLLPGGKIFQDGKEYVNFSSNDYLALSEHPKIMSAALRGVSPGVGTGSSRLMAGSTTFHHLLEEKTAEFKNKPAALVFNSGYQANVGVISSVVGKGDCVFSDRLNHASIIDGINLSMAKCFRYRHNDVGHLEELVKKNRKNFKRALIVTESLFSMDGDEAPLGEIVDIKDRYECLFMLDEAHATGIFGARGRGKALESGFSDKIDIVMGTFSKAMGVFGAYVALGMELKNFLINRCRSFIYSTALPVSVVSACIAAIDIVMDESWRREELFRKILRFRNGIDFATVAGRSQIVPVLIGDSLEALRVSEDLKEKGWWVTAVRPPTVPPGGSRLRVSITMHHDMATLDAFLDDINRIAGKRRKSDTRS
jgi:8-amino-7-oxononanoate synthase